MGAAAGKLLGLVFSYIQLLFGLFFFGPVIAEIITLSGIDLSVPPLAAGMAIGGLLGLMAQFRKSWIWV